jgi:hypothetical protein
MKRRGNTFNVVLDEKGQRTAMTLSKRQASHAGFATEDRIKWPDVALDGGNFPFA